MAETGDASRYLAGLLLVALVAALIVTVGFLFMGGQISQTLSCFGPSCPPRYTLCDFERDHAARYTPQQIAHACGSPRPVSPPRNSP